MKKSSKALALLLVLCFLITGCGGQKAATEPASAPAPLSHISSDSFMIIFLNTEAT